MRILSLNYEYPPLGGGGGKVTENLNLELSKLDNQIITLTSHINGEKKVQKVNPNNIIYRINSFRKNIGFSTTFEKIGYIISAIYNVGSLIEKFKPNVVHCHFAVPTGFVAYYIKKRYNIPYILTSHGGDVPGFIPEETGVYFKYFNWIFNKIWQNAFKVVAVSTGVAKLIKRSYDINADIIHNGINAEKYKKSNVVLKNHLRLIFAGRLNKQKNIGFLVDSLKLIKNEKWKLKILGDGPEKQNIQTKINKTGLNNKIELFGWKDSEDIKKHLENSDVLCLTSISEGLPVIGLEALASGLAIIGTNIPGISDIVKDGKNGILIELNNTRRLADSILYLINNVDKLKNMKKKSIELAEDYDWMIIAGKYLSLFNNCKN